MKKNSFYLIFVALCFVKQQNARAQTNIDLSDRQIAGYTMMGLGFTLVAYTYSGQTDKGDGSNQRPLFYSIGAGMALTGLVVLLTSPKNKKKVKHNAWSNIDMSKVQMVSRAYTDSHNKYNLY